ncbi:platelet-activating factor acetylhydrolase IB subunit alpha, partial [Phenoliferia sp. Uapishka_3]
MTSVLSERQKDELHKSILDYLNTTGFRETFEMLKVESGQQEFQPDPKAKWSGLLEKKWTSVIRLQKKTSRVWDAQTGETKAELRGHDHVVEVAVFAPSSAYAAIRELAGILPTSAKDDKTKLAGTFVATGSRDKTIKLWDSASGQCLKTLTGHDNWIRALVFHPSGKFLLSASDDKTIRTWDLATGRCIKTLEAHAHFVTCMAWGRAPAPGATSSNGNGVVNGGDREQQTVNVLATGSVDQSVKIWLP